MRDKTFVMDFAKLMISAAWADGDLTNDEINALKDLLFTVDNVSEEDWAQLNMYIDSPTTAAENQELLERLVGRIQTSEDKRFVLDALQRLFSCDGKVTPEEAALLEKFRSEFSRADTTIFSLFTRAIKSAVLQRSDTVKSSCLRESHLEDYIKNPIYYHLQQEEGALRIGVDHSGTEAQRICLAVGLLANVANVDSNISTEERITICKIIANDWKLPEQQADLLLQIACDCTKKGLDYFRLSHGFFDCTTFQERKEFLKTLFRIANSANKTSNDEIEAIRKVAISLKMSHEDFIDAKLTIPREDRNGL